MGLAHSRPVHVIVQLLEGAGCQLPLPLLLGGGLLLCGRTSSITLHPQRPLGSPCAWPSGCWGWGSESGHCGGADWGQELGNEKGWPVWGGGPRRWAVPNGWGIQEGQLGASAESLNHP